MECEGGCDVYSVLKKWQRDQESQLKTALCFPYPCIISGYTSFLQNEPLFDAVIEVGVCGHRFLTLHFSYKRIFNFVKFIFLFYFFYIQGAFSWASGAVLATSSNPFSNRRCSISGSADSV